MSAFIRVRPLPDAPSFVHFSWLDEDPRPAAAQARRPRAARLPALLDRLIRVLPTGRDS
jgi:hypothetical protein